MYWFLQQDQADKQTYNPASFTCGDFAEMLHNNAEKAGWRCAFVAIKLGPSELYPTGAGHALNVFETTDRGLCYIDCTGSPGEQAGPSGRDKGVNLLYGLPYIPYNIFGEAGWKSFLGKFGHS